jgi:hypothetical protein
LGSQGKPSLVLAACIARLGAVIRQWRRRMLGARRGRIAAFEQRRIMSRSRLLFTLAALAIGAAVAGEANAQNFFERLFGIRPAPAPVPPGSIPHNQAVPGAYPPGQMPGAPFGPETPGGPPAAAAPPAPPKPVVIKAPSEDGVVARDLKLNGATGAFRIERAGAGLRARVTLQGRKASNPVETCSVELGRGDLLPLNSDGKPDGVPRYTLDTPACPIAFDVLEGAILVNGPQQACTIEAADCAADPRGLWGPEPGALLPQAGAIEEARGYADRAVRENYKALAHRAGPQNIRPVVSEQAAFSSEREQTCRGYAREGAHGFCHARYSEARALALATRLGLNASAAVAPAPRPRRMPPPPGVPLPSAGAELSPTEIR